MVNWSPLKLGKGLVAPAWATALGWLLALSSVSLLPIWAIYALATTPGTLQQVATRSNQRFSDTDAAVSKRSNNLCPFLCPRPSRQRFKHLCTPGRNVPAALPPPTYSPMLPLTEKQKEPVAVISQNHVAV